VLVATEAAVPTQLQYSIWHHRAASAALKSPAYFYLATSASGLECC